MKEDKRIFNYTLPIVIGLFFGIGISILTIPLRENPYEYPSLLRTLTPLLTIIPVLFTQYLINRSNSGENSLFNLTLFGLAALITFTLTYYVVSYKILTVNDPNVHINLRGFLIAIVIEPLICLFTSFLVKKLSKLQNKVDS